MKKRLFAFAMLAAMLTASACGGETTAPADGTADAGAADTTAAVTDDGYIADDLPAADYGGYEFVILTHSPKAYIVEAEDGDVLNGTLRG